MSLSVKSLFFFYHYFLILRHFLLPFVLLEILASLLLNSHLKLSQHEIFFFPDNCFTSSGIFSGIEVLVNVCLFLFKNWFLTLRFVPQKFFVIKSFMFGHFCIRPLNMLTLFLSYGHPFLSLVFNAIFDFLGVSSPN